MTESPYHDDDIPSTNLQPDQFSYSGHYGLFSWAQAQGPEVIILGGILSTRTTEKIRREDTFFGPKSQIRVSSPISLEKTVRLCSHTSNKNIKSLFLPVYCVQLTEMQFETTQVMSTTAWTLTSGLERTVF